jgi:hypothetical protein
MGSGIFMEKRSVARCGHKMENSGVDGGDSAEEERRRFRGVEKEIRGREYKCCYGNRVRWEARWRGREKEDSGETTSGPV